MARCLPGDGNTQFIEKWAEVGGATLDVADSPALQRPDGKAQLPSREGFYRKELNRCLPRQIKPALGLAL